jgi:hypothetical protein
MSLADEIEQLAKLKAGGTLTEAEFQQAKTKLLARQNPVLLHANRDISENSLGRAANRYVSFQIISWVIGILIFLILVITLLNHSGSSLPVMRGVLP